MKRIGQIYMRVFKFFVFYSLFALILAGNVFTVQAWSKEPRVSRRVTTLFLDTDIGSDVDDSLALLTVLGSKDYKLVGISTVNGDTATRARIVQRVLEMANSSDIPVGAGVGSTLLRRKQPRDWHVQLEQHLDQAPKAEPSQEHGVDLMIRKIHEHPGLTVAAVGPLTNVALAMIKDPSIIPDIGQLVVVGGAIGLPAIQERGSIFVDYKSEYNFNSDPDAARLVFESDVPILMSGLNPALQVLIHQEQLTEWRKIETELAQWIVNRVTERLERHNTQSTHLGDVMGVVMAAKGTGFKAGKVHTLPLQLEIWGDTLRTVIDPTGTGRPVTVVLSVNQMAFYNYFLNSMQTILEAKD